MKPRDSSASPAQYQPIAISREFYNRKRCLPSSAAFTATITVHSAISKSSFLSPESLVNAIPLFISNISTPLRLSLAK